MIGPSTRLFGLFGHDARAEGAVVRLTNYLFAHHGIDAALVAYTLPNPHVLTMLDGFRRTGRAERLWVVPAHQAAAGAWLGGGPVDTLWFRDGVAAGAWAHRDPATWLDPDVILARALALVAELGAPPTPPVDWREVLTETTVRASPLTRGAS